MKITSSKLFDVPAGDLWVVIHDPANMPAWNTKCISATSTDGGELGSTFEASFSMGTNVQETKGEIVAWEYQKKIEFRYLFESATKEMKSVTETYLITSMGEGRSKLKQVIDLSNAGFPWWAKLLMNVISRFGRSTGPGPLEGIEELLNPTGRE